MQILIIFLALLLTGCADDGAFDFSEIRLDTTNNFFREPNEGKPSPDDSVNGSGSNPVCLEIQNIGGGFLWKPISESNGNLVVLFPKEFTETFQSVTVNGESGNFSGFANGDRQHWRFSLPGGDYQSPATIIAESLNGECQWIVSNTSERAE